MDHANLPQFVFLLQSAVYVRRSAFAFVRLQQSEKRHLEKER